MSDTKTTKELYGLYVQRFGNCSRTPYQAEYYRKWLDLINSCSTNEEAQEKSKQNGLYTAGAAAVAMDRVFANKQAAVEMGWKDVAEFCDEILKKIEADPYYTFTHTGLWGDLQAKKNGWIKTIESFHRLFIDFVEFDDTRCEPDRAIAKIKEDLKLLSKPSSDFATLAAMPSFRALIDCSDEYYKEFTDTIIKAATGNLDTLEWSTASHQQEIEELWNQRDTLKEECSQWYKQEVKSPCLRLSPETEEGSYKLLNLN